MSAPAYVDDAVTVHLGDCLDILATLPDCSVDAVVTDPPAGIAFMGRDWDRDKGGRDEWVAWLASVLREALRVAKPGSYAFVWALPRTSGWTHRALEDAGWEVRDCVTHLFGSGFPKSLDVSKAIDKARHSRSDVTRVTAWIAEHATARQLDEVAGTNGMGGHWTTQGAQATIPTAEAWERLRSILGDPPDWMAPLIRPARLPGEAWDLRPVTQEESRPLVSGETISFDQRSSTERERRDIPATDAAREWQGWGTALKPSSEHWWLARKPLVGTVAANVTAYGTGALNIDACRVATTDDLNGGAYAEVGNRSESASLHAGSGMNVAGKTVGKEYVAPSGRWPANVVLGDTQAAALDANTGTSVSRSGGSSGSTFGEALTGGLIRQRDDPRVGHDDSGGASRFFPTFRYEPKAPSTERPTYWTHSCDCEDKWPTTSRAKDTAATTTTPAASSTSKSGNDTTGEQSPTDTRSITSTRTSRTTTPPTSWQSPPQNTSDSTPVASCATTDGGSPAAFAANSSPSPSSIGTSAAKGGHSTGGAGHATLPVWSATSVCGECGAPAKREAHSTVKPLDLMRWLVRLVTPRGGVVLDPFAGSGTTGEACVVEGFKCILIEREPSYLPLIVKRLSKPIQAGLDFGDEVSA